MKPGQEDSAEGEKRGTKSSAGLVGTERKEWAGEWVRGNLHLFG